LTQVGKLDPALRAAMKSLKVVGLVEDAIDLPTESCYKLHTLLPYLLRTEASLLEDSGAFIKTLESSCLDYYNFRAWYIGNDVKEAKSFIIFDWPNICAAISLLLEKPYSGEGDLEILLAVRHVTELEDEDPTKSKTGLKFLNKALRQFSSYAVQGGCYTFSPTVLSIALQVWRLSQPFYDRFAEQDNGERIVMLRLAIKILENYQVVHSEMDAETRWTSVAARADSSIHDIVADPSRERAIFQEIWDAEVHEYASDEQAVFFYGRQFTAVLMLLDYEERRNRLAVTQSMVEKNLKTF
jgi:hypothetical protein